MKKTFSSLILFATFAFLGACGSDKNTVQLRGQTFLLESWGCSDEIQDSAPATASSLRYYLRFTDDEVITEVLNTSDVGASASTRQEMFRDPISYPSQDMVSIESGGQELLMKVQDRGNKILLESIQSGPSVGCERGTAQITLLKGKAFLNI
jgi:hypothetical protein